MKCGHWKLLGHNTVSWLSRLRIFPPRIVPSKTRKSNVANRCNRSIVAGSKFQASCGKNWMWCTKYLIKRQKGSGSLVLVGCGVQVDFASNKEAPPNCTHISFASSSLTMWTHKSRLWCNGMHTAVVLVTTSTCQLQYKPLSRPKKYAINQINSILHQKAWLGQWCQLCQRERYLATPSSRSLNSEFKAILWWLHQLSTKGEFEYRPSQTGLLLSNQGG